jgi:hypothetical protein
MSVEAYGEIYGAHPLSFEFDAKGNMIPNEAFDEDKGIDQKDCLETVRGLRPMKYSYESMGPAGAVRYN